MGKKILLADDSITIQKVIELTFSDEDFEVVTVGNGRLAIERVSDVRPDVVLCDIIMPEKDGYEVCDFIKKNPALSHIPVLLLTGAFEPFDQEKAARVGCDGFLAKPFEPQTLISKVKDLLAKGGSRTGATGAMRQAPAAAPTPAVPAPPTPPAAAVPPPPFSSTPAWSAPPPAPPAPPAFTAPPPFRQPEPELEPEPIEEEPEEFPTMASRPGAPSAPSVFDPYVGSTAPPELTPMTPEESATLGGAGRDDEDDPATAVYQPGRAPWSQQTIEVPLEMRAQAGVSAQSEPEPLFEEVFDEEPAPLPPSAGSSVEEPEEVLEALDDEMPAWSAPQPPARPASPPPAWSAPQPAPPAWSAPQPAPSPAPAWSAPQPAPAPAPAWSAPPPPPTPPSSSPSSTASIPPSSSTSFADVTPAPADSGPKVPASEAAEVSVTPDMVEKIAQRVVAQISEKVVREVAWEVIPDLAEALIKREIERLKAELQRS